MKVTLKPAGAGLFLGQLEDWDEEPALEVYVGNMGAGEKYCAFWTTEKWEEADRSGHTWTLWASGKLYPDGEGTWTGEIVHVKRGKNVRAWRGVARKGSPVVEFTPA